MSSRFGRDPARDDLFSSYNRSASPSKSKNKARTSPYNAGGYGLPSDGPGFSAYPGSSNSANGSLYGGYGAGSGYSVGAKKSDDGYGGGSNGGYRSATPNSRGQYNSATLDELESQNEEQTGVLIGKVKMLKDLTHLIGDEIRDSTTLAEKMNDQFENSRNKIKGTMNRMLRMAKKTGVGWKAWVAFFAALVLLFWWVWLG
ncbi:protein transport protein bet1 [Didymella heteroderae]|uniref:Protein transport protein bet1 n=1 Tax=Didymella heteroderae TaxID=1769908 RepID=A0A9P5BWL6_9PLEO|nr:protein transport protein bet1 [Didymella heteroderae]